MHERYYREILQMEHAPIVETHMITGPESNELGIAPRLNSKVTRSARVKYVSEVSSTEQSLLYARIKSAIYEAIEVGQDGPPYINYSRYLSDRLHYSYHYLSTLFSRMNGVPLKQYIIAQRIELVKHMLVDQGLGLSEIAWKLGYCSVPHLSNQFKKVTGCTPTSYKHRAHHHDGSTGILCEPCKQRWMALLKPMIPGSSEPA